MAVHWGVLQLVVRGPFLQHINSSISFLRRRDVDRRKGDVFQLSRNRYLPHHKPLTVPMHDIQAGQSAAPPSSTNSTSPANPAKLSCVTFSTLLFMKSKQYRF